MKVFANLETNSCVFSLLLRSEELGVLVTFDNDYNWHSLFDCHQYAKHFCHHQNDLNDVIDFGDFDTIDLFAVRMMKITWSRPIATKQQELTKTKG